MNKDELRELLHKEYKTENWKRVTEFVFPNVQYLQSPQAIPFKNEKVERFTQIGNVKLKKGKNLAMFEVKVANNVNLSRNRVELRKLVENLIDQDRNHGVLVIYEQGKEDYRFTFTTKSTEFNEEENDFVEIKSDPKRFTYILGKNESCKTAANRFWELSTLKDTATIKDVENAFSVERLNKEFFNKYKEFYEDFVQFITGKRSVKEKGKWVEKEIDIDIARPIHKNVFNSDDKLARNFVKLLLGRLVFIQFLQKKGWMGVQANSKLWENGDPDFLLNLYKNAKNKAEFHSKYLFPLFYKALNTPNRPNDIFELTGNRVPYLNGGLFEIENLKTKSIDFPKTYFEDLLEFFGQYNFTIDENDPLDHEVGIDAEMLGHIFENLLEDNKDKGAFYTPKPIVQYMCQESLVQYLKTYLQEKQIWPQCEDLSAQTEMHLQNFVRKKIAGELLNNYDEHLARALRDVKICDPAIGSGAFPMGLLNEIFNCMQVLHDDSPDTVNAVWEMEEWAPEIVKKNIIQNSIYGVDIEKGAVDIARLRFWLCLIVDEKEPNPLPNLDFKIVQGNSLLECYEGIDLSKIAGAKTVLTDVNLDLFGKPLNAQVSLFDTKFIDDSNISELIDKYFNSQAPVEKQKLKNEIDAIIHKHIDYNLEFEENKILEYIVAIKKKLNLLKVEKNQSAVFAAKTKKAKEKLTKELQDAQENFDRLKVKRKQLHDLQKTAERPYFLWHLYFKDVFEKGGFDIVIGNPPYVDSENMTINNPELRENLTQIFSSTVGNWDLFVPFIEFGLDISKAKAVFSFIIPNKVLGATYTLELRKHISENNLIEIRDYSRLNIFTEANVYPVTLNIKKDTVKSQVKMTVMESKQLIKTTNLINPEIFYKDLYWDKYFFQSEIVNVITRMAMLKTLRSIDEIKILGAATVSEAYLIKNVVQSKNTDKNVFKLINTGTIDKWISLWGVKKTQYLKESYEYPVVLNSKLNNISQTRFDQSRSPKIIIAGMSNEIEVFLDKEGSYLAGKSTTIILGELEDLKIYSALLNSKAASFYVNMNYHSLKMAGGYLNISNEILSNIPIPNLKPNNKKVIISLVNKLLAKLDVGQAIEVVIERLDNLIYRLFDLSYQDVKIINPEFELSEQEYINIKIV